MKNESYINIQDMKPEPNRDIEYIDFDGNKGICYLCSCCLDEWRCPITGGYLLINVVKWRYYES